jgi:U6 snRNA-associated Sm-like protein LSm7
MAEISRDPIIRLQPFLGQKIMVNFLGGRVVEGTLKGFDHLNNLVLNDAVEQLRGILQNS